MKQIILNRINVTLFVIFSFTIMSVACSSASESENELTGTIEIDGSSTVFPISEAAAEDFGKLPGMSKVRVMLVYLVLVEDLRDLLLVKQIFLMHLDQLKIQKKQKP